MAEVKTPAAMAMDEIKGAIAEIPGAFAEGGFKTRISYIIMGLGQILRGQWVKGIAFLLLEVGFFAYMFTFGGQYLSKFNTLGTIETYKKGRSTVYGDNSFLILLFGILSIIVILAFIVVWWLNIHDNHVMDKKEKEGTPLPTNGAVLGSLLDKNFDKTLLALPVSESSFSLCCLSSS